MNNEEKEINPKKCDCCGENDWYVHLVKTPFGDYCLNCIDDVMKDWEYEKKVNRRKPW